MKTGIFFSHTRLPFLVSGKIPFDSDEAAVAWAAGSRALTEQVRWSAGARRLTYLLVVGAIVGGHAWQQLTFLARETLVFAPAHGVDRYPPYTEFGRSLPARERVEDATRCH